MDVTPLVPKGQQIIQSYAHGRFKVSGESYDGAVFVMPEETVPWQVERSSYDDLQCDDFSYLIARKEHYDVFILGMGERMSAIPVALKLSLKNQGVHMDFMDTGAACRTYNVLMAEGRRVFCALLPA